MLQSLRLLYMWVIDQVWDQDGWILAKFFFRVFVSVHKLAIDQSHSFAAITREILFLPLEHKIHIFPLQLALQCTETAIQQPTVKLPLPTEDIMDLLNLCLTSNYFQYNGKHYKQLHGTAMGSPVSVVVAEIVMQHVEERALANCRQTVPLWLRYVDDTFTAVHKDEIDDFHDHFNEQNADIQFTKEIEENGKLSFLDCLISRDNNELRTTVYRKPTHTDRLLDESSYNPTSHEATTIWTLTRRAQPVCDTPDSLRDVSNTKTTTTLTLLNETFTALLKLTLLTRAVARKKLMTEAMSMEDLWPRQSVHGWVLFLGIKSVYND